MVISPKEGVRALGQIVYCELLRMQICCRVELSVGWSRGESLTSAVPTILAERKIQNSRWPGERILSQDLAKKLESISRKRLPYLKSPH